MSRSFKYSDSSPMVLMVSLSLAACASVPASQESGFEATGIQSQNTAVSELTSIEGLGSLPPQTLGPNECGLFFWSQTDISKFLFFTRSGDEDAVFLFEGMETPATLIDAGGNIFGQFLTNLTYAVQKDDRIVEIDYEPGEDLVNGARISTGHISYTDSDGWKATVPIVGARACMTSPASKSVPTPPTGRRRGRSRRGLVN